MDTTKEVKVLIAEDDDGHAELIREALEESGVRSPIIRFSNGEEVWNFLSEKGSENLENDDIAYLLLLDINMPRMTGTEVLRNIKQDHKLKSIPVIMLTTTDDPREVEQCYELGCNVYITKPVDYMKFTSTLQRLGLFMQIVKL
ncbi:MAG: response regulator [Bacteroidetes bacterium]|nr:MAG: response regulator [Bacteroidota bacterium]